MTPASALRLMTRVARLYYGDRLRQAEIAQRLDLSQSRVSRLLRQAELEGIVRTTVTVPQGCFPTLEELLVERYGLREAVVVDAELDADRDAMRAIGEGAAAYLEATVRPGDVVGISSWSETLLATVESMNPLVKPAAVAVVQMLGGVGDPATEKHATRLTTRLAELVGGEPRFLPAPGVTGSAASRRALLEDPFVTSAVEALSEVTIALVGIGALEPSSLLAASGNVFADDELQELRHRGVIGDICLRFFDADGAPVETPLDDRVVGVTLEQLRLPRRRVGIAGGPRKRAAIRAALVGGLVNVLITDRFTAEHLAASVDAIPTAALEEVTP